MQKFKSSSSLRWLQRAAWCQLGHGNMVPCCWRKPKLDVYFPEKKTKTPYHQFLRIWSDTHGPWKPDFCARRNLMNMIFLWSWRKSSSPLVQANGSPHQWSSPKWDGAYRGKLPLRDRGITAFWCGLKTPVQSWSHAAIFRSAGALIELVIFRPVYQFLPSLILIDQFSRCKRGQFVSAYGTMAVLLTKAAVSTILQKHLGSVDVFLFTPWDVCNLVPFGLWNHTENRSRPPKIWGYLSNRIWGTGWSCDQKHPILDDLGSGLPLGIPHYTSAESRGNFSAFMAFLRTSGFIIKLAG